MTEEEPGDEIPEADLLLLEDEGCERPILYSLAQILGALSAAYIDVFGLYDVERREIVQPVTDPRTAFLALQRHDPPRLVFAYKLPNDRFVQLHLVVDE